MCGICGVLDLKHSGAPQHDTLERMCQIILHRGPDDEGHYFGDGVAMGSITTRSRRAATSMRQVRTRKHGGQAVQMNNGK